VTFLNQSQNSILRRLSTLRIDLLVSTGLLIFFIYLGIYLSPTTGADTVAEVRGWVEPVVEMGPLVTLVFIIINNVVKAIVVIVSGVLLGIPAFLFIAVNGMTIGSLAGAIGSKAGYVVVAAGLLPHGVIELPALILATALSFSVGKEALSWMLRRESHLKGQLRSALSVYTKVVFPALVVAAIVEVTVTPWLVKMVSG